MPLWAIIIRGKYLVSRHWSGAACDCCFTCKPLIFSLLCCTGSRLETAPRDAFYFCSSRLSNSWCSCLQTSSSHLALADGYIWVSCEFGGDCCPLLFLRGVWPRAGALFPPLLCDTLLKTASEHFVTGLSGSWKGFPNKWPQEVVNLLGGDLF